MYVIYSQEDAYLIGPFNDRKSAQEFRDSDPCDRPLTILKIHSDDVSENSQGNLTLLLQNPELND